LSSAAVPVRIPAGAVIAAISATRSTQNVPARIGAALSAAATGISRGPGWRPAE
jgi:DNA-binding IclR family transcriptional regulator